MASLYLGKSFYFQNCSFLGLEHPGDNSTSFATNGDKAVCGDYKLNLTISFPGQGGKVSFTKLQINLVRTILFTEYNFYL